MTKISIHAPLAGCDKPIYTWFSFSCISIHAPLAGCDVEVGFDLFVAIIISIHAPLAGCDTYGN